MSNAVIISIPVLSGRDTRGVPVTLTWKGHRVGFSASGETGNGVIISAGIDKADTPNNICKMSSNVSLTLSLESTLTSELVLSSDIPIQLDVTANLSDLTIQRMSTSVAMSLMMSANMSSIWRSPIEAGMRSFLVVAIRDKLYYGS